MRLPLIILIALTLASAQAAQAQFFKKLGKRVQQKVENTVVEKTANKAAEKTARSMDKVFEANPFGAGTKKGDPSVVENEYVFSWKYSLKISTKEGDVFFDYYLQPGAAYFGFTSPSIEGVFTVMDNKNKVTAMFMASQGDNMGMVTQMVDDPEAEEMKDESAKFSFETLPAKVINGFDCKGIKATNEEMELVMYFTAEAEVSFDDIYRSRQANIPPELKEYFSKEESALMISMDMKSLKDSKMDAKIECVGLEKADKTILKSDYKFM